MAKEYRCKYCGVKVTKYATICSTCNTKLKLIRQIKQMLLEAKKEVQAYNSAYDNANKCVHCGAVIPEGRLSCTKCENLHF
jgi:RNA polymerase-binding transcription factor DksA